MNRIQIFIYLRIPSRFGLTFLFFFFMCYLREENDIRIRKEIMKRAKSFLLKKKEENIFAITFLEKLEFSSTFEKRKITF